MIKLFNVVGARPQFVKAAVISRATHRRSEFEEVIVHTGQHFDNNMSGIFFEEMQIPKPDFNLDINGMGHGAMTGHMLIKIEELLIEEKPDYVVVYGDTNSTLAAALAAKKLNIRIVHVEAGVRNFDETMPEEINRYVVDRISDLNITCTWLGEKNLENEGYKTESVNSEVKNIGDVMYDAALFYSELSDSKSDILSTLELESGNFIISTVHRASNTDDEESLTSIVKLLNKAHKECPVVLPLHPRTKAYFDKYGLVPEFRTIDPIGYFDMIQLVKHSKYVLTDSGGVVREAYFFEKPSIILLEKPLWPELVWEGACIAAKPKEALLLEAYEKLKTSKPDFSRKIYGDGQAGDKILQLILDDYEQHRK
ncbi:MAG: UDP-N-acetylglucosamine 2-epimerase (non-hydrolyzing) [Roseivirga sp.]|uniref:non-hydrolyzing UDP-N-acetylglucosamine 2-epimerase n=1 Tax=Roseivirga sp. TaxID=1964215 RepID=UPI001B1826F6|nr:UDP-N-acetylglucosamine 2-epimerase (non-hydrolyzing) [Roseivirga sp.]MBO6660987.1 UDP-N-acetylglucosamine 2-epimerase (non-hydrolyzing) [Roseivirga sp.]MBO6760266.1 UDP-N-acetylglucosamine 2-epimerase (non-hydrolyzing) [Roseivirga sp.]MBO6909029.1 UDP-N-acetylglucosamine 2-epimerase (non-hydrolyzing) [Roseivirga sp.]